MKVWKWMRINWRKTLGSLMIAWGFCMILIAFVSVLMNVDVATYLTNKTDLTYWQAVILLTGCIPFFLFNGSGFVLWQALYPKQENLS